MNKYTFLVLLMMSSSISFIKARPYPTAMMLVATVSHVPYP